MSGRLLKARFKCSLAHFEHNMTAACFDMVNKISLLTMCCWGTNRSRYASNVHLVLSFQIHVCLVVQPNYANKGEKDSLLQIMTLKGVYCSRKTVLAQRRQGWPPTLIVDWVYERSIALVHIDNMERYGYDVDVDVVRQSLQEFLQLCSCDLIVMMTSKWFSLYYPSKWFRWNESLWSPALQKALAWTLDAWTTFNERKNYDNWMSIFLFVTHFRKADL